MMNGNVKENESRRIVVAMASDEKYVPGLIVTMWSICENASRGVSVCFHVLDVGISEANKRRIDQMMSRVNRIEASVVFHEINLKMFSAQRAWKGSYATYARLMLQDILPDEDFIIYSDVDMLWLRDIAELWAMRDADIPLWATRDGAGFKENTYGKSQAALFATYGIKIDPNKYYNAGLLLLNLKKLRDDGFTTRIEEFMPGHHALLTLPDQNLYNILIPSPPAKLLDYSWGVLSTADVAKLKTPCVIHYAGNAPWTQKPAAAEKLWWPVLLSAAKSVNWHRFRLHACLRILLCGLLSSRIGFELFYLPFRLMSPDRYHHRKKRMFVKLTGGSI